MSRSIRSLGLANEGPKISQKGHVMFRNIAAALVAASVIAAPVLAQEAVSGASKGSPAVTGAMPKKSKVAQAVVRWPKGENLMFSSALSYASPGNQRGESRWHFRHFANRELTSPARRWLTWPAL